MTIKETFATLRQNRPLAILCGASFFYLRGLLHRHRGHALLRDLHSRRRGTRVPGRAAQHRRPDPRHAVHPEADRPVRQEDPVPVRRHPHRRRRCRPLPHPGRPRLVRPALPRHQGRRVLADQHADVRARARHRRVRRVEVRQAVRGRDLRDLLLHPQAHPVDRRRRDGVGPGARRLRLGDGRGRRPRAAGVRADRHQGRLRAGARGRRDPRHDRVHHLPADRPALPRGPRRDRGPQARRSSTPCSATTARSDGRGEPPCGPCPASPTRSTPT